MTKQKFKDFLGSRIVFLDGATGINLIKAGMPKGVCPEQWILANPDALVSLQNSYIEAGSEIIYAPTFTGNRIKLKEYGLEERIAEINTELVKLSKKTAAGRALVAGNMTMTGLLLKPLGEMDLEELIDVYKEQIKYLAMGGADLLVVETMNSLAETRAALIAAKEVCSLPVIATLTFEANGRTLYGTDPKTVAVVLKSLGAMAIGVNCGAGPDKMQAIISEMAEVSDLPLIAKPNAGMPILDSDGQTVYNMAEKDFAESMLGLIRAGATLIGGCCGTTPEYIRQLKANYHKMKPEKREMTENRHLTSERKTVTFNLDSPLIVVGERINPTGKKKLKSELKKGSFDLVLDFAEEQEQAGAMILDINMGMEGIDEVEMMLEAIAEITCRTFIPLAIDSSNPAVIEKALRNYPGRALINSISLEKAKFETILPLAEKYGAMFILLPLSDSGLPANLTEKIAIIEKITSRAIEMGIPKADIIVDALVTTVGANKQAAIEALETIRYCKEQGYLSICGLSNISFGLPGRSLINAAFLKLARDAGLSMAIANPSFMMDFPSKMDFPSNISNMTDFPQNMTNFPEEPDPNYRLAVDLLLNREDADLKYIDRMSQLTPAPENPSEEIKPETPGDLLKQAILKGQRAKIIDLIKMALNNEIKADEILDSYLLPAINEVGDLYDKGEYFLPQLIAAAETMKLAATYLEPMLAQKENGITTATIVIATVAGDIHDIGKNLVVLMLRNHGFRVIDLGKDVASCEIISKAKEHKADIIALSALMTTTMAEMKNITKLAKENNLNAYVIIGGAVTSPQYADEIGARGHGKDAADAVRLVKRLMGK
ncbi:MAG: homocysteine S-methyltransferase family protein [Lachnospiraceae bacterium]|nr:homocysteine S-methyltransferase family protein [Lachnospiraceae bacterium]